MTDALSAIFGQQCRVDVDDFVGKCFDKIGRDLPKKAGQNNQICLQTFQKAQNRIGFPKSGFVKIKSRYSHTVTTFEHLGATLIGEHCHHLCLGFFAKNGNNVFGIGATARCKDYNSFHSLGIDGILN